MLITFLKSKLKLISYWKYHCVVVVITWEIPFFFIFQHHLLPCHGGLKVRCLVRTCNYTFHLELLYNNIIFQKKLFLLNPIGITYRLLSSRLHLNSVSSCLCNIFLKLGFRRCMYMYYKIVWNNSWYFS